LRNNLGGTQKSEYTNSFGVGGLNIGSHRVVAINLPQIAYIAKYSDKNDKQSFYNILESRIKISQDILDIHRELLMRLIDNGNLPMYKHGCMDLSKQYSTLGFIGLYECLEILGMNILSDEGLAEAKNIINLFNKLNTERTAKDGRIRNVEQIPGESAAVTFCLKDKLQFANTNDYDLYANQYIPLIKEALMTDRIRMQGEFDSDVSGGSMLHIDIDQELTKEQIINVIQLCAKNNVIYFALDDCLAQCTSCGKVYVGKLDKSPCHNAKMRYFLRVVGFRTPVDSWQKVRRTKDFPHRYLYHDTP
jgi:ribonucleoside-triphosphate reductase